MEFDKKDALIGGAVVVGAALLVLALKGHSTVTSAENSGEITDIVGGFASAGTIFVPTSSYDIQYNTYKGAVTYSSSTENNSSSTSTTYGPGSNVSDSPIGPIGHGPLVPIPDFPIPRPPIIHTGGDHVINPVPKPPITKPKPAPAPNKPAPKHIPTPVKPQPKPGPVKKPAKGKPAPAPKPAWESALVGGVHYTTPKGGWNNGSVVDNLKSHGFHSDLAARKKLAAKMGIKGYKGTAAQNKQMLKLLNSAGV